MGDGQPTFPIFLICFSSCLDVTSTAFRGFFRGRVFDGPQPVILYLCVPVPQRTPMGQPARPPKFEGCCQEGCGTGRRPGWISNSVLSHSK